MQLFYTFVVVSLFALLSSCSNGVSTNDQTTVLNDSQPVSNDDPINGLWRLTSPALPNHAYLEVHESMVYHFVFSPNPWGLGGSCYSILYETISRNSVGTFNRESSARPSTFAVQGNQLTIAQQQIEDESCLFPPLATTRLERVDNISSDDFALCELVQFQHGLSEALRVAHYDPVYGSNAGLEEFTCR